MAGCMGGDECSCNHWIHVGCGVLTAFDGASYSWHLGDVCGGVLQLERLFFVLVPCIQGVDLVSADDPLCLVSHVYHE